MAPEMFPKTLALATKTNNNIKREYHYDAKAVDIYAMGVCLFEMVTLTKPFSEEMTVTTIGKIQDQEFEYHPLDVDSACKDLIGTMLKLSPRERPSVDAVVNHRWIAFGTVINTIVSLADKIFH